MTKEHWFNPERTNGFRKSKTIKNNVAIMLRHTDQRWTQEHKLRVVGRQALALSNITQDEATKKKAKAVSKAAFKRLKEMK